MDVKITTLIENNPDTNGKLLFEHGLSLFIETDGKKILFDTGQSGDFIENAKKLGKDLSNLDFCIISHGHYDHSGGLKKLIREISTKPQIIVGEEFFSQKYKLDDQKEYKFIGNSFQEEFLLQSHISVKKIQEEMVYLGENIIIFHHFSKQVLYEELNKTFFIQDNQAYLIDDFADEISMGIITKKGLVVIVGCSHIGIINILKTISQRVSIPIYAVIGGTHLVHAKEERMIHTIDAFKRMHIERIAVSHCTGERGIQFMKQEIPQQFIYNNTGNIIEI